MIFFDTETAGLHGMPVLIQWAEDDGPVELYSPWSEPIYLTLNLIERFCEHEAICGFNLAFDWFMLQKLYTTLHLFVEKGGCEDDLPMDHIDELGVLEKEARDGPCVKPRSALDLMLHARKGPYQSTMARSDIRIKRVPSVLANKLAEELERRVPLPSIYFAKRSDKNAAQWSVRDVKDADGEVVPELSDVVLSFNSSTALKYLAIDALKIPHDKIKFFDVVGVDDTWLPEELGYAPFALAIGRPGKWNKAWPEVIRHHISHWRFHGLAREYATDDVVYTRGLYHHFGRPAHGDNDSILACMVASCRWRGYAVDLEGLRKLRQQTLAKMTVDGFRIPTEPRVARRWIEEPMSALDKLSCADEGLNTSTKKSVLEVISEWTQECPDAGDEEQHPESCVCKGSGSVPHPSAARAKAVLEARKAQYKANLYDKFLLAGRFHASYSVIGTLSSRMGGGGTAKDIEAGGKAGGDGMNPQGIENDDTVRVNFPLAFPGYDLGGGDFDAFEVSIAEAVYEDKGLRSQLLTCEKCSNPMVWVGEPVDVLSWKRSLRAEATGVGEQTPTEGKVGQGSGTSSVLENNFYCTNCLSTEGKKIHALFGVHVYPAYTYEALRKNKELYTRCKRAVFQSMYGGTAKGLADKLKVPPEVAEQATSLFHKDFPGVKRSQLRVERRLGGLSQMGGIGSRVTWNQPQDYIESMFGFRRYFTLENKLIKAIYDLAGSLPPEWKNYRQSITRRDRVQTTSGATMTALYAAAFSVQASNIRAGINHEIQSPGADITKDLQCRIWELQPHGVHKFLVQPMNTHDEIQCPHVPEIKQKLAEVVSATVEKFRPKIPLIRMKWASNNKTWADK